MENASLQLPSAGWTSYDDWDYGSYKTRLEGFMHNVRREALLEHVESLSQKQCKMSEPFSAGQYWCCFEVVAQGGALYIARALLPPHPKAGALSMTQIANEVEIMRLVREKSSITLPEVFAYELEGSARAIRAGCAHMVIEGFYGNSLLDIHFPLDEVPEDGLQKLVTQWAQIEVTLSRILAPSICIPKLGGDSPGTSLVLRTEDVGTFDDSIEYLTCYVLSNLRNTFYNPCHLDLQDELVCDQSTVEESTDQAQALDRKGHVGGANSQIAGNEASVAAETVRKSDATGEILSNQVFPSGEKPSCSSSDIDSVNNDFLHDASSEHASSDNGSFLMRRFHQVAYLIFLDAIRKTTILHPYRKGPFPLLHMDIGPQNILINNENDIVAVIDWQMSQTAPWQAYYVPVSVGSTLETEEEILNESWDVRRNNMLNHLRVNKAYVQAVRDAEAPYQTERKAKGLPLIADMMTSDASKLLWLIDRHDTDDPQNEKHYKLAFTRIAFGYNKADSEEYFCTRSGSGRIPRPSSPTMGCLTRPCRCGISAQSF